MWWYFVDLARSKRERDAIEALAAENEWLHILAWRIDESMRMVLDADITVGERTFGLHLVFPVHFPQTPALVFPRDKKEYWSLHQFGRGGELCLEYGPDNWISELTGADLLASAYRLLSSENPPSGVAQEVASRHEQSVGQATRSEYFRLLITRAQQPVFAEIHAGVLHKGRAISRYRFNFAVLLVSEVTKADGSQWKDPEIPPEFARENYERNVAIYRLEESAEWPSRTDVAALRAFADALGIGRDVYTYVFLRGSEVHCLLAMEDSVIDVATLYPPPPAQRLDPAHATLKQKSVAIVGCGSLGSKFATSLARSGVGEFHLIDDDVLLPDNLVRNDLDWRDAGLHKADALHKRILHVNPHAKVQVRRIRLAGQEAGATAASALAAISQRSLIIDASADANVFNLLSSIAEVQKIPMLWGQVYGGGFGGFIARHRPEIEPSPVLMRQAVEHWFGERGYKPKQTGRDYATGGEGPPMIADDADVASIAAAAARLAIDTLIGRQPSFFPYSAYVIGLAPEDGLFSQPFQTYPIEMPVPPPPPAKTDLTAEEKAVEVTALVKMLEAK